MGKMGEIAADMSALEGLASEEWRRSSHPKYEISNLGRFRGPTGLRKLQYGTHGYPFIGINVDGKAINLKSHIEVALAFLGPRPEGFQVAHKNGNRGDPRLENLTYKTRADNEKDKLVHGTLIHGEAHRWSKLTDEEVEIIRVRAARGETQAAIARDFNVTQSNISKIVNRGSRNAHIKIALAQLSEQMVREKILRISDNGAGFSVYMRGDILGTGETVGEAFDNAARQRRLAA